MSTVGQRCSGLSKSKRHPASQAERWLPWAGMPPASLSIRARWRRFHVAKVVLRLVKSLSGPPEPGVQVGRPRSGLADPAGVGLGWDHVAQMLERVQDVHSAVLDAVLVPGDEASAHPSVVRVLAGLVEQVGVAVEPFDDLGADRGFLAQPDGRAQHEDVGRFDLLEDGRPVVLGPAVLGHVGPDAGGDVTVDRPDDIHREALTSHDLDRAVGQPLGVRRLRRALQGAVDEERTQVAEVPAVLLTQLLLHRRELGHRGCLLEFGRGQPRRARRAKEPVPYSPRRVTAARTGGPAGIARSGCRRGRAQRSAGRQDHHRPFFGGQSSDRR
jgi:hypothetical protein